MLNILYFNILNACIVMGLILLWIVTYKTSTNKEKNRPFESGFDPSGGARLHFCIKFFLVGVIFLIFDVEVSLIMPIPFRQPFILLFLIILFVGLAYEWYYGGLE